MQAATSVRDANGRFAKGHPGGPGRPRRPVEQEYLATLNAAVTLDAWRQIVDRAVEDAKDGDAKAREWLAKFLMGDEPLSLVQLAAEEKAGLTADVTIESLAFEQWRSVLLAGLHRAMADGLGTQTRIVEANDETTDVGGRATTLISKNS